MRGPAAGQAGSQGGFAPRTRLGAVPTWLARPLPWIFVLALFVRLVNLTYHSLWYDEVVSTYWAARPVAEIWRVGLALAQDKHPPVYYLLLRGWMALFGTGDLAVRSLGAVLGALAVLPAYGIGRRLGGQFAAALGALLVALSPFLVWYSQEARMFMPATTFALAGLYGMLWLLESRRGAAALLTIAAFAAALYTYLYSAFMLPVAGAWLVLWWWLHRRRPSAARSFWLGAGCLAMVSAYFLPLARSAWQVSGVEAAHGRAYENLLEALANLLKVYTLGWPAWNPGLVSWLAAGAAILAFAGCLVPGATSDDDGERWGGAFLLVWIGAIILVGGYLLSRDQRVFAETRYQIALVPALCLAWGRALAWLWKRHRAAGLAAAVCFAGITLLALPSNWIPANRREDWRSAAGYVTAHAASGDAILIQADYVHIAFERYFRGPQNTYFPFTEKLADPSRVDPPLAGLYGFDGVWVVQSHQGALDPNNLILNWFGARYPLITEIFPAGIAIHAYSQHYRTPKLPAGVPKQPGQPALGPLRLLGCTHNPPKLAPGDSVLHPPSAWIHVTTYWGLPGAAPAGDLHPRVTLVDGAGQIWGEGLARDGDTFHVWPTSRWLANEVVRADHDVNLNPITPNGQYRLVVEVPGSTEKASCGNVEIASGA